MHIKDIIIDGFKSYAKRTEIESFDPQFNAITGLNGSGKSNILDAILFVLGLTHYSLARVNSLLELIYKAGKAGINKATVTIIFDNSKKSSSPPGLESYDTITVTRQITQEKTKYFLNGHNETHQKIKSLFKSIQLNIDNPHFLVQQGKITKIINLKPAELISMLEETAGTALYNDKKKEARRTMEKKEEKLKEISDLLSNEIEPQMEKLRREKETFYIWKSGEIELSKINKQLRGFEFYQKSKVLSGLNNEVRALGSKLDSVKQRKFEFQKQVGDLEAQHTSYISQKQSQSAESYRSLDEQLKNEKKNLVEKESELKNARRKIEDVEKNREKNNQAIREAEQFIATATNRLEFNRKIIEQREKELKDKKNNYEEAIRNLEAFQRGEVGHQDTQYAYKAQRREAERNLEKTIADITQLNRKLEHIMRELEASKSSFDQSVGERARQLKEIEILEKELERLEEELNSNVVSEQEYHALAEQKRRTDENIMRLDHKLSEISRSDLAFTTKYRDPETNFDRRKVRGRVFQLIEPINEQFIVALDQAAGGNLKSIVVDSDNTAKMLMKRDCFGFFVRLIPNNKIVPRIIPDSHVKTAEKIAKSLNGKATPAYDLVRYDPELASSIKFAFGSTFVCSSIEIAKKIAYGELKYKCVTLEGDIIDPSGTLSGGYINQTGSILMKNQAYRQYSNEREQEVREANKIEDAMKNLRRELEHISGLRSDFEQKSMKRDLLREKIKRTTAVSDEDRTLRLSTDVSWVKEQLDILRQREVEFKKEISELDTEMSRSQSKGSAGSAKESLQERVRKLKPEVDKLTAELKKSREEVANMEVKKENAEQDIKALQREMTKEENIYAKAKENRSKLEREHDEARRACAQLDQEKKQLDQKLMSLDGKILSLKEKIDEAKSHLELVDKEAKSLEERRNRNGREIKELEAFIIKLEKENPFIQMEKDMFGNKDSDYDFSAFDYEGETHKFAKLKQDQEILQKRVNHKVEAMFEKVEREYKTLIQKRETIRQDKLTINAGMDDLDIKKKEALEKCYIAVNKNFGKIFSTFLPGTNAKVQQIVGKDLSEGLELSVAFNNVWKSSLTELSGGQRSLLALSFLLSLLLYKPAPFYILDEIDAALDLSHTENIGAMISKYFPQSQFIIISLKEGMFNNANVLFKTQFVDGVSAVERLTLKTLADMSAFTAEDKKKAKHGKKKN